MFQTVLVVGFVFVVFLVTSMSFLCLFSSHYSWPLPGLLLLLRRMVSFCRGEHVLYTIKQIVFTVESLMKRLPWKRWSHCCFSLNPLLHSWEGELPYGPTGTSSSNCQETETCMVWAYRTTQQSVQTILPGTLECGWCRSWQGKCWMDNLEEWMSVPKQKLHMMASCRKDWKRISAESSLVPPPPPPRWSRDWTE